MEESSITNYKIQQNENTQKRKQLQLDKLQDRLQVCTTEKMNMKKQLELKEKEYDELMAQCQSTFQLEQLQILRIMQLIEDEDKYRCSLNRQSYLKDGEQRDSAITAEQKQQQLQADLTTFQTNQQILDKEIEQNELQLSQIKKEVFKLQDQLKDKKQQIETSQSLLDEIQTKKEHMKQLKIEKESLKNDYHQFQESLEKLKEEITDMSQLENQKSVSQKICEENESKIELMENELESIIIKLNLKYKNIFDAMESQEKQQENINIEEIVQQKEKELNLEIEKIKKQITDQREKEIKNLDIMNKVKLEAFQDEKSEQISEIQNKINEQKQLNQKLQIELVGVENLENKIQEKYKYCQDMKVKWAKDQATFKQLSEKSNTLEKQIKELQNYQKTMNQLKK